MQLFHEKFYKRNKFCELFYIIYGYIICKAKLVDCVYMDEKFMSEIKQNKTEYICGYYEIGRYAWILDDVKIIEPIKAKGQLGIWNYNK